MAERPCGNTSENEPVRWPAIDALYQPESYAGRACASRGVWRLEERVHRRGGGGQCPSDSRCVEDGRGVRGRKKERMITHYPYCTLHKVPFLE